jgi:protein-tyrosine phosphatase
MQDTCYLVAGSWPGKLAILARPRGGDWLEDEVHHWENRGFDVVVSLLVPDEAAEFDLEDEEKYCRLNGIQYMSLPVPDRGVPGSREAVLELVSRLDRQLADGKTVGIHCRQGIGRSGLLAACLLVSIGLSPKAAFERLSQARGRPVPETSEQRRWVEGFAPQLAEVGAGRNP